MVPEIKACSEAGYNSAIVLHDLQKKTLGLNFTRNEGNLQSNKFNGIFVYIKEMILIILLVFGGVGSLISLSPSHILQGVQEILCFFSQFTATPPSPTSL